MQSNVDSLSDLLIYMIKITYLPFSILYFYKFSINLKMNDNLPPCGIEEIIYQVFNFDNLKKYIEYLEMNSARAFNQINECKLKLLEIDEIKTNLNEINTRLDIFTNKFHEVEQAISFQQIKILEVERKSQGHEEVLS